MKLHEQWCAATYPPEDFWRQPPRLIRSALAGYQERVFTAVEIAGGKVKRDGDRPKRQDAAAMASAMRGWAAASRSRGGQAGLG